MNSSRVDKNAMFKDKGQEPLIKIFIINFYLLNIELQLKIVINYFKENYKENPKILILS